MCQVFFDIKITPTRESRERQEHRGRVIVGVFGDALPMTVFNFMALVRGYRHNAEVWTYKSALFHRIVPDFLVQTGDVLYQDGRGGRSVYAPYFIDEVIGGLGLSRRR